MKQIVYGFYLIMWWIDECVHTVKICNLKHCIENVLNMEQRINQVIALGSHPALFILAV